jgi:hypothetical protein
MEMKMKTRISLLAGALIGFFLFACQGDQPENEVISMEELIGDYGNEEVTSFDTISTVDSVKVVGALGSFIQSELAAFDTSTVEEYHILDRFSFNTRQKIEFKSKEEVPYGEETMVRPRANLFYYAFKDTNSTKNAFYNWLDCFGSDCAMVKIDEELEAIKMPPAFALVYDTVIVAVDYRCEDAKYNWRDFEKELKNQFNEKPQYELKVACGGPLKWK